MVLVLVIAVIHEKPIVVRVTAIQVPLLFFIVHAHH